MISLTSYKNIHRQVLMNMRFSPIGENCLFLCKSTNRTFKSREHVFPESLGNMTVILPPRVVCDRCNNYFSELESEFVHSYPTLFWRFVSVSTTKKGNPPRTEFPQGGFIQRIKVPSDPLPIIQIQIPQMPENQEELERFRKQFDPNAPKHTLPSFLLSLENTIRSSRIPAKIALELLYLYSPLLAFSLEFNPIRRFAREGHERLGEFIPYAWGVYTGQPFLHSLLEFRLDGETRWNFYAFFTMPGAQFLYPLSQPTLSSSLLVLAQTMGLKIETQGETARPVYLDLDFKRVR